MTFPEGVDYTNFYMTAREQGVKVKSKYAGVFPVRITNCLYLKGQYEKEGKRRMKYFPFDKHGEIAAHRWYTENMQTKGGRKRSTKIFL